MTHSAGYHDKAYVCLHIFDASRPVLLVSRADGDWCFLCGDVHEDITDNYRVVGKDHILDRDPTLRELDDLPADWEAERMSVTHPWQRRLSDDGSNGYEEIASIYVAGRGTRPLRGDAIGAATVRAWAQAFSPGATVLDLGSGPGEPSTRILQEAGLAVYAVDASSAMVAAFRERFPGVPIEQNTVEASTFFHRTFDGVLAWGLLFLLKPATQALVIEKVSRALNPGGRFLFTAPKERVEWLDAMTGRESQSLGAQAYTRLLRDAGLTLVAEAEDEGENHYFFVERRDPTHN
jgi:SAM-dependent methyltransferase